MMWSLLLIPIVAAILTATVSSLSVSTEGKMKRNIWLFVLFNINMGVVVYIVLGTMLL